MQDSRYREAAQTGPRARRASLRQAADEEAIRDDSVVRREAREASHPGSEFRRDGTNWYYLLGGEPVPGVRAGWDLGSLLDALDKAEREGRCPLHPAGSRP